MPSLYPSSTCATDGSAESTLRRSDTSKTDDLAKQSVSKHLVHRKSDDQPSTPNSPSVHDLALRSMDYQNFSTSRIAAYVKDHVESRVPHRHPSLQESIQDHTRHIAAVLEGFETAMKK